MRSWIILLCFVVVASVFLTSCAPPVTKTVNVTVTYDEFMKQKNISRDIQMPIGEKLTVTLAANTGSTGFSWPQKAEIGDPQVLEQIGHENVSPRDSKIVGAPGSEVFTFRSLQNGFSKVYLEYGQPWQGGQKAAWTFTLNVTAK